MAVATPVWVRLLEGIELTDSGCWRWVKGKDRYGYGKINVGGRNRGAHRVSYETFRGRVPDGLQLDHLCRVRNCINPRHMECVTSAQNTLRGDGVSARAARRTHCPAGHPYDESNTYVLPNGDRGCRACRNASSAAYKARKRIALKGAR